jgi:hypothetical protein
MRVILVAGKVFTHNSETGKFSALIQCWNIVHQIERDGFQCTVNKTYYTTFMNHDSALEAYFVVARILLKGSWYMNV